ncbi:M23 family metallopeptidase [Magnetovibrio sp.]|uniref:M23 family metallopeptidase n=1 Tax=Magnetovibrio sp. TaxID=2024836 RepID=UPI002F958236
MSHHFIRVFAVVACLVGMPVLAVQAGEDHFTLALPVDCQPGATCWVVNYVDLKPGPGTLDYNCGDATYDAPPGDQHKGTDFAVRDMAAVRKGVAVFAAASGQVIGKRDGMADISFEGVKDASVANQECGNGLRIRHDNGLITQYCHMRQNSVMANTGDRVERGQQLGMVGLSGQTVFPHLHFQVERGAEIVDPFAGLDRTQTCGIGENTLWDAQTLAKLPYQPTAIYNVGFAPGKPDLKAIRDGQYQDQAFDASSSAMVVWAEFFRIRAGDEIVITITDPEGHQIHNQRIPLKANKARYFAFSGLRLKTPRWQSGTYRGYVSLIRNNETITVSRETDVR